MIRLAALPAVFALVAVGLAGCQTGVKMWDSCTAAPDGNPSGTDGTYVLWCREGVWMPIMTVSEYLAVMRHEPVTIAPLPPSAPQNVWLKKFASQPWYVIWVPPTYDGGAPADHFVVDWLQGDGTVLLHQVLPDSTVLLHPDNSASYRGVATPSGIWSRVSIQECNVAGCGGVRVYDHPA